MRLIHAFNAGLLVGCSAVVAAVWSRLPPNLPVHFGLDGTPNRWAPKAGALLFLTLMPWVTTAVFYSLSGLIRSGRLGPGSINVPHKEEFLALSAENQKTVMVFLADFLVVMAASLNLLFVIIDLSVIGVALGWTERLPDWAFWPGLTLVVLTSGMGVMKASRLVLELSGPMDGPR